MTLFLYFWSFVATPLHAFSLCEGAFFISEDYWIEFWCLGKIIRHIITLFEFFSAISLSVLSAACALFIVSSSYTDMPIFGQCPAQDDFYLVMCSQCSQVVKPQAFQAHYGTFHTLVLFILTPYRVARASHANRGESAIKEWTHTFVFSHCSVLE